jgi:hypothetical protein
MDGLIILLNWITSFQNMMSVFTFLYLRTKFCDHSLWMLKWSLVQDHAVAQHRQWLYIYTILQFFLSATDKNVVQTRFAVFKY